MQLIITCLLSLISIASSAQFDTLIPPDYDEIQLPVNGYIIAKKNDSYGVLNVHNQHILPFEYVSIQPVGKDMLAVTDNLFQTWFLHPDGTTHPRIYFDIRIPESNNETILVNDLDHWGGLNLRFEETIPFEFTSIKDVFADGAYIFERNLKRYGVNDAAGNQILPDTLKFIRRYNDYYAAGNFDSVSFYHLDGTEVSNQSYSRDIRTNQEGTRYIVKNTRSQSILLDEHLNVLHSEFDSYQFYQGDSLFIVHKTNGISGIFNINNGSWIYKTFDYSLSAITPGFLRIQTTEGVGMIKESGEVVFPPSGFCSFSHSGNCIAIVTDSEAGIYSTTTDKIFLHEGFRVDTSPRCFIVYSLTGNMSIFDNNGNLVTDQLLNNGFYAGLKNDVFIFQSESGGFGLGQLTGK